MSINCFSCEGRRGRACSDHEDRTFAALHASFIATTTVAALVFIAGLVAAYLIGQWLSPDDPEMSLFFGAVAGGAAVLYSIEGEWSDPLRKVLMRGRR